ncbi:acyl-CoA thioesterase [Marinibactrum halimedae]|uniref:Acyl-CoA thioesterase n=1 Tax=Marinibactrum halimedae TaxID=1444977 RepID=A0AA37TAT5_9GAMM|nr:hotdog domain-containing protein [Marinibactrum halimedae]MCD9459796.1 hypothetical protein [Marinibactrum halimedae]GLS27011.1 acyl-CoA thioesterase [Marinibactrum halimedae]
MENYQLVLTEHLNHYGYLFGGTLLKWVDESAYMAARLDHPGKRFVTAGMNEVSFKRQVELGSIVMFDAKKIAMGNTSVTYEVNVMVASSLSTPDEPIFSTQVTLVCIDEAGNKFSLMEGVGN